MVGPLSFLRTFGSSCFLYSFCLQALMLLRSVTWGSVLERVLVKCILAKGKVRLQMSCAGWKGGLLLLTVQRVFILASDARRGSWEE
jgi:hypothetical protein